MARFRVDRRLVADAQLDRVEPTGARQLIYGRLHANMPGPLARRTHVHWHGHVSRASRWVVRRSEAAYIIRVAGGGLLGELMDGPGLLDDVMRDCREPAVALGAQPDALDGGRAIAGQRETSAGA